MPVGAHDGNDHGFPADLVGRVDAKWVSTLFFCASGFGRGVGQLGDER